MEEMILTVTAIGATGGLALVAWIATVVILKMAYEYEDWFYGIMGSLLLFCSAIPATGITLTLLLQGVFK